MTLVVCECQRLFQMWILTIFVTFSSFYSFALWILSRFCINFASSLGYLFHCCNLSCHFSNVIKPQFVHVWVINICSHASMWHWNSAALISTKPHSSPGAKLLLTPVNVHLILNWRARLRSVLFIPSLIWAYIMNACFVIFIKHFADVNRFILR